jgi:hypothetical protein
MLIADGESRSTTHVSEKIVKGKNVGNCSSGKKEHDNKQSNRKHFSGKKDEQDPYYLMFFFSLNMPIN